MTASWLRFLAGASVPLLAPARCDSPQSPPRTPKEQVAALLAQPPRPFSSFAPLSSWMASKWTNFRLWTGLLSAAKVSPFSAAAPGAAAPGQRRQKVVIVGSGWASASFLAGLDMTKYEPVVISPRDYFTFTPLLPSVCVGTLPASACMTSMRELLMRGGVPCGQFYEARVEEICPETKTVRCRATQASLKDAHEWDEPFDYLVVTAGAEVNTFNIPGVKENAFFVKELEDARRLKAALFDVVEAAAVPSVSEEERKKLLHFVVVGAGPTGVEVAAEIDDFFQTEGALHFPHLMPFVRVTLVEMLPTVLAAYNGSVQAFAKRLLEENPRVNLLLQTQVVGVKPNSVKVRTRRAQGAAGQVHVEENELACGLLVWASGIKSPKICLDLAGKTAELREAQKKTPVLLVDQQMKVRGCRDIYALGDCCRLLPPPLVEHAETLFEAAAGGAGTASTDWLEKEAPKLSTIFPQLARSKYDFSKKPRQTEMTKDQFVKLLAEIDLAYRAPAPTAQNAKQAGLYLAQTFNAFATPEEKTLAPAFVEKNRGALVYLGQGQAAADIEGWRTFLGGRATILLWKAAYLQMQFTFYNAFACLGGWLKTHFVGRAVCREHLDGETVYSDRRK
ncbi:putative mitochondrial alternative NADH dehydrogenase 1 [Neospora caninum Liverpool]|uniref:NADH:ubiquinone reductase (non-electrogenic) n=1 Tax=Neospora caninum (strain Liverpool) TaxID=572307 RepID=F0V830_NEOCL|nr:putative mitochondrial alternative NADH dehydrogenase 1 [Neospora caninum Liverpool]CBZ49871.1 putative mitochondrial alternative NADH dehydrogenase 1 [Neospora caninum Liverpool]CEL64460.1 TPA: mitochondrial alternative NADH dehydrogenase 1,putative [Neospora caninum Liverpool]|eukprot:XP_003879906.1 putative mitochondrial alternative NADH dehydrogenase 1 [Neospora caninum Liverpool]